MNTSYRRIKSLISNFKGYRKKIVYRWQIRDLTVGGKFNLVADIITLPLLLLAFPLVLLVYLLRPFVLIRFGVLSSRRIGGFACQPELYLYKREIEKGPSTFDIFYYTYPICNRQLKKMWERKLHIWDFAKWLAIASFCLPGFQKHIIPDEEFTDRDVHGYRAYAQPHISFTPQEESMGFEALKKMDIPEGKPFICFYMRDSAYLNTIFPKANFYYQSFRDCDIQNCRPAVEEMARQGYFMLRMGAVVKDRFNINNSKIIDYANDYGTDFLDIFLTAKCRFFITTPSGLSAVAELFRRPIVWVNSIPLEYYPSWSANYLIILKKLWLRKERRFMAFREILESGVGRFCDTLQYDRHGIEVIENTPEEIKAVAVEMEERLNGAWQETEEDKELQRRFWEIIKSHPSNLHGKIFSKIGAEFLRQNKELLS